MKTIRRWSETYKKNNKGIFRNVILWLSEKCFNAGWWLAGLIGEVRYQELDENGEWVDVKE